MKEARFGEFIALAATMISLVALTIDVMLPALPAIALEFSLTDPNDQQLIVSSLFVGLGVGQLLFGPLSDAIGRRPAIFVGFALFFLGTLICLFTQDYQTVLAGRLLQGLGAASPRIVMLALIRDRFEGPRMAQVLSFVMGVFILVPALAPLLGQLVLLVGSWHLIFVVVGVFGLLGLVWFSARQPETLPATERRPLQLTTLWQGLTVIARERETVIPTLVMSCLFGSFLGYLSSAQQIFAEHYALGALFPFYFAALALCLGLASFLNAKIVVRYGMETVCLIALIAQTLWSAAWLTVFTIGFDYEPPLSAFMIYCGFLLFCQGLQFGNLNALAMKPLGHLAGLGASVIGAVSTILAVPVGVAIGQAYDGTPIPLVSGFVVFGTVGLASFSYLVWSRRVSDARHSI